MSTGYLNYVTLAGLDEEALAKEEGRKVAIEKVVIGLGLLPDDEQPQNQTALLQPKAEAVCFVKAIDTEHGFYRVEADIPIPDAGYNYFEIGTLTETGILYSYARSRGDYVAGKADSDGKLTRIRLNFRTDNSELITITHDDSVLYTPITDFEAHVVEFNAHCQADNPHPQYVLDAHAATNDEIDNVSTANKFIKLQQLWRALTPIRDRANEALSVAHSKSNPNLLINGDFSLWQRGTYFAPFVNGAYTTDRWKSYYLSGSNVSSSDWKPSIGEWGKLTSGLNHVWDADANIYTYQAIENGVNLTWGKTVTFSAEVFVSDLSLLRGMFFDLRSEDGVIDTIEVDILSQIPTGKNFHFVTGTVKLPESTHASANVGHLAVRIFMEGLAGCALFITHCKLEHGSVATPFVPDHPQVNLAKCQRYCRYIRLGNLVCSPKNAAHLEGPPMSFSPQMRVAPTVLSIPERKAVRAWTSGNSGDFVCWDANVFGAEVDTIWFSMVYPPNTPSEIGGGGYDQLRTYSRPNNVITAAVNVFLDAEL